MSEFEDFMRNNYKKFVAYCISRNQNPSDADEIVSEAFIRLYTKWSERCEYDELHNKKWMYNTIGYIIMEYARINKRHESDNIDDYTEFLPDKTEVDENLKYQELFQSIEQGLREDDRELFRLAYIEQKSYTEICEKLRIKNQSLRTRISRLKDRIERILKK